MTEQGSSAPFHATFTPSRVHLLRIPTGADLLEALTDFAVKEGITAASISYLGAVRRASLRAMDQETLEYYDFDIDDHLEVLAGVGNITLLDDEPFVHTHAVFGELKGKTWGGHLNYGTEVFLIEATITELEGEAPVRTLDATLNLSIWGGC